MVTRSFCCVFSFSFPFWRRGRTGMVGTSTTPRVSLSGASWLLAGKCLRLPPQGGFFRGRYFIDLKVSRKCLVFLMTVF